MAAKKLNPRQEAFCREYILDHNATQAAIRAGYSSRTAYSHGQRLLKHGEIKKNIKDLEKPALEKAEATSEKIVRELSALAFYNPADIFDGNKIKDIEDWPDDCKLALTSFDVAKLGNMPVIKIKMHDKIRALELLGKRLGMWIDRIEERKTEVERKIIKLPGTMPDD